METIYTPDDAAKKLKLSSATVRQYLRDGVIKGVRAGNKWRITETALKEFMEKGTE
jgi:excisionase family DNA binding protein